MQEPLIDVLIPVHNGAATLREALTSIQQQTVRAIRILVVDDGSTDATPSILAKLAADDPRINVISQANAGIVDALNAGLDRCKAEYVARHDADDRADPDRFATQLTHLQEHDDCVAVSSYARRIDEDGRLLPLTASPMPPELADPMAIPAREPYLMHPFLMVRRAAVCSVGGYRHVFQSEDTDLYWRLQEVGRLHNITRPLGDYRVHSKSSTNASAVNARIGALTSQLSAVSARRRRAGGADLNFPRELLARYRAADSLERMIQIGADALAPEERRYLEFAAPAKFLELSGYRLFNLDMNDCSYARRAWDRGAAGLAVRDRKEVDRLYSVAAADLAHKGRLKEALKLSPARLRLAIASRLAYRLAVPNGLRAKFRELRKRAQVAKGALRSAPATQ